jgi:hypothetical protein
MSSTFRFSPTDCFIFPLTRYSEWLLKSLTLCKSIATFQIFIYASESLWHLRKTSSHFWSSLTRCWNPSPHFSRLPTCCTHALGLQTTTERQEGEGVTERQRRERERERETKRKWGRKRPSRWAGHRTGRTTPPNPEATAPRRWRHRRAFSGDFWVPKVEKKKKKSVPCEF